MMTSAKVDRPGVIYILVNKITLKAYIRLTTKNLIYRLREHRDRARLGYKSHLYDATRKYGLDFFDYGVLEYCSNTKELEEAERDWIKRVGTVAPNGYNLTVGGQGTAGTLGKSDKWRAAMASPLTRYRQSQRAKAWRARMTPEENKAHNEKTGAAHRGRPNLKFRGAGNPAKDILSRINISEGLRRSWQDPEVRERRRLARLRGKS